MSFVIGKGRRATQVYPTRGNGNAVDALSNRYLVDPNSQIPSAFSVTAPTLYIVAAVNVVRRASGIFQVNVQVPMLSSGIDTTQWGAIARAGSVASGGVVYGDWLIDDGAVISVTAPSSEYLIGTGGGTVEANGVQMITMVGVNPAPLPAGASAIVIAATTVSGSTLTPGVLLASAYELP